MAGAAAEERASVRVRVDIQLRFRRTQTQTAGSGCQDAHKDQPSDPLRPQLHVANGAGRARGADRRSHAGRAGLVGNGRSRGGSGRQFRRASIGCSQSGRGVVLQPCAGTRDRSEVSAGLRAAHGPHSRSRRRGDPPFGRSVQAGGRGRQEAGCPATHRGPKVVGRETGGRQRGGRPQGGPHRRQGRAGSAGRRESGRR